jgi:hypothetical protein
MSETQNIEYNYIKTANRACENMAEFKYLRMTVANQNFINEKIKSRLNAGNACYHSVQNILSFHLLSKNVKLKYTNPFVCSFI